MTYLGELKTNWRYVAGAALGLATGYGINNYLINIFVPHLVDAFGWSKSDMALVSAGLFLAIICQPIAGRLTDALGVRFMATIGVMSTPIFYLAFSAMNGSLMLFFALIALQIIIVGGTTSSVIYARLIAEQFKHARGVALAIVGCAPAAAGALIVPIVAPFMETHGWRAGYVVVAVTIGVVGAIVILLIPKGGGGPRKSAAPRQDPPVKFSVILHARAFYLIIAGLVLCNLFFSVQVTQFKLVLLEKGMDSATGSTAIALYALGVLVGRFLCGLALDHLPTHLVAAIWLGLPGIGHLLLASPLATPGVMVVAVLLVGLSMGAEGDLFAYLAMKYFPLPVFSTMVGIFIGTTALAGASGSLLLSFMLKITNSYSPFLVLCGICAFLGSGILMMLARAPGILRPDESPA